MVVKRKCNNVNKKILAGILCGMAFLSMPQVANAGSEPMQQPGTTSNVNVNIETEPIVVDITVPGSVGFVFNADGSNEIPDNFSITNHNKIASFYLKEVGFDGESTGWKLASEDEQLNLNEKAVKFKLGSKSEEKLIAPSNGKKDITGTVSFSDSEFVLAPESPSTVSFLIDRPVYTDEISQSKAFDMTMSFEMK